MSWNIRCSLHVYSTTTRMLQLACLGIVRDVQMLNQTLSKHSAVKFMENVFIGDIFKGHHHLVEWIFQISLFWIFSALLQHKIAVLGHNFWRLGRAVGCFRHGIAIYKFATCLVEESANFHACKTACLWITNQKILPKNNELIINSYHKGLMHAGVNQYKKSTNYWSLY